MCHYDEKIRNVWQEFTPTSFQAGLNVFRVLKRCPKNAEYGVFNLALTLILYAICSFIAFNKRKCNVYLYYISPWRTFSQIIMSSKCKLTFRTRATHRLCISDIGMIPPTGWMQPITAIVEGEMSGGNTYLYRLTSLSLTSSALWSMKGKPNRYPVAQMMASMLSATDPSSNSTDRPFNRRISGLTITLPAMILLGRSSLIVGCCDVMRCSGLTP